MVLFKFAELKQEIRALRKRAEPAGVQINVDQMSTVAEFEVFESCNKQQEEQKKLVSRSLIFPYNTFRNIHESTFLI